MKKLAVLTAFFSILIFGIKAYAMGPEYSIHFIDVAQEECILIKGEKKSYLIDTARDTSSKKVLAYLNSQGVNKIDTIIITHYHDDHYGGLKSILEHKFVDRVILPAHQPKVREKLFSYIDNKKVKLEYISSGFQIVDDNINLTASIPENEDLDIENNNSVIIAGTIDNIKYVFASDIESKREKELLKYGKIEKCDVLKIPHHGLNTSSTGAFIKALNPKVMVITCDGVESPDKDTLKRLSKSCETILRSDMQGDIVIRGNSADRSIDIHSYKVVK